METSILITELTMLKIKSFDCLPSKLKWGLYHIRQQNSHYIQHTMMDSYLFRIKFIDQ